MKDPISDIQIIVNKLEADTHTAIKEYYRYMRMVTIINGLSQIAFYLVILATLVSLWRLL